MTPCFLIDNSIFIFRYYFSSPRRHEDKQGRDVSTVLSYFRWLLRFVKKEQPRYGASCFDESLGSCFRNEIDPNYKSNRSLPDEELAHQLFACKHLTELLGLPTYASSRYEADDLLACLFRFAAKIGHEPMILTRDKDLGQLLETDLGMIWDYGYDDAIAYDSFSREFGIAPERIAEFLAIAGDSSDSIVGIKGVGKKTVAALFEQLGDWETVKARQDQIATLSIRGAKGLAQKIKDGANLVDNNLKLTRLADDCIKDKDLNVTIQAPDVDAIYSCLSEFNASDSLIKLTESVVQ